MPHVLVNGPASWNTLVQVAALPDARPQTLFASGHRDALGGTSAGKALTLARLGVDVTLRTAVGDDDAGDRIRAALSQPGLDLVVDPLPGPSERHLNLMADDGGRLSVYLDLPPEPGPAPATVQAALARADAVVLDLAGHSRELLPAVRAAGVPLWCDVHDDDGRAPFQREFAEAADVLVVSADRLDDVEGYLDRHVARGARWAVCTRGRDGALALGRDEGWWTVSAVPVTAVDSNGAGDGFTAGLLAASLRGLPLPDALRHAAAAGALTVASAELSAPGITPGAVEELARAAVVTPGR
ncbi:carbohydrate kinase family protein [Cellulomonas cellasea]|uniref:Sugar/nucleoside kinase (Ribokinase family) n=1 Tax=Cellulomonas cellasea TaxID=43670 RepID=A0A7W4Y9X9_9CELL|nr:carbohydrate kinase family protein [Cellulomonas cellasea]MBB2921474.1 sugar/nucleoside kinase (ribokinase family) [Cellulomonas cellasea]